jgi:hypothetical protein
MFTAAAQHRARVSSRPRAKSAKAAFSSRPGSSHGSKTLTGALRTLTRNRSIRASVRPVDLAAAACFQILLDTITAVLKRLLAPSKREAKLAAASRMA